LQTGNGEVVLPDRERVLAGLGFREPEARIDDLVGAEEVRVAKSDLLIQNADGAVCLAVERKRNGGMVDARFLAVADA
jgi:3,4-dihydroxy-2-butanone 4-phosphate synthase